MAKVKRIPPALASEEVKALWCPAARRFADAYERACKRWRSRPGSALRAIHFARKSLGSDRGVQEWRLKYEGTFRAHIIYLEAKYKVSHTAAVEAQKAIELAAARKSVERAELTNKELFLETLRTEMSHELACETAQLDWNDIITLLKTDSEFLDQYEQIMGPPPDNFPLVQAIAFDVLVFNLRARQHQSATVVLKGLDDRFQAKSKKSPERSADETRLTKSDRKAQRASAIYEQMTHRPLS